MHLTISQRDYITNRTIMRKVSYFYVYFFINFLNCDQNASFWWIKWIDNAWKFFEKEKWEISVIHNNTTLLHFISLHIVSRILKKFYHQKNYYKASNWYLVWWIQHKFFIKKIGLPSTTAMYDRNFCVFRKWAYFENRICLSY